MRVALLATTAVGARCGWSLLGERSLLRLGLIGKRPADGDPRLVRAPADLSGWDVLVADDLRAGVELAARWGLPLVMPFDDPEALEGAAGLPVPILAGCRSRSGIGPALLAHRMTASGEVLEALVAWTAPGSPLRTGEAVPFPDPVGPRWARPATSAPPGLEGPTRALVAPSDDEWLGVVAGTTAATRDGVVSRTVGVADQPQYLEAIALAAGALTLAGARPQPGLNFPAGVATTYLEKAMELGLEVAAFTERRLAGDRPDR